MKEGEPKQFFVVRVYKSIFSKKKITNIGASNYFLLLSLRFLFLLLSYPKRFKFALSFNSFNPNKLKEEIKAR